MINPEQQYIHIYTEANPNPNSMKFVFSIMLLNDGASMEYVRGQSAASSPLAQAIFDRFEFIDRVFFMMNFITLTKNESADWYEVSPVIRAYLREYFEAQKPIFEEAEGLKKEQVIINTDSETVKKIKGILDEYIKPAVEMDGGLITFSSFDETTGTLKVKLQGSCSGCPSSTITLKAGIENLMQRMLPQVREVVSENA